MWFRRRSQPPDHPEPERARSTLRIPHRDGNPPYWPLAFDLQPMHSHFGYSITGRTEAKPRTTSSYLIPEFARIEGSYYFTMYGRVFKPKEWTGYTCELLVNDFGCQDRFGSLFIGNGWWGGGDQVVARLTIAPAIARDLLEAVNRFAPAHLDLTIANLRPDANGKLIFDVCELHASTQVKR